jgi:arylformamidase
MVHWPGDPAFHIRKVVDQKNGDVCTLSHMEMSVHTGTHMDAPRHFLMDAPTMESMPIEAAVGLARVVEIRDERAIGRDELLEHDLQPGERILFRTANSDRSWNSDDFDEDFIFIAADGAEYLAECGIRTVGVDYLSVGGFRQDGVETHQAILRAGIWIIEGLDLREISAGLYEMICLPLKLVGSDGAPARAALRRV